MPQEDTKRVFISYSHDSTTHKTWVRDLASFLQENGVQVVLDQWDVKLGEDLPDYMERSITTSDYVLIICTDKYIEKANDRTGGVGYEKTIITSEMLPDPSVRSKFIPIVKDVTGNKKLPKFFGNPLYLDLSGENDTDEARLDLLRTIHGVPVEKPELGISPFDSTAATLQPSWKDEQVNNLPSVHGQSLDLIFYERFTQAFPGVRGIQWFEDIKTITARLGVLFSLPLQYKEGHLTWWWRGRSCLQIDSFQRIDDSVFLMNIDELIIHRIAAVNFGSYDQIFVYVETQPDKPTGLYPCEEKDISRRISSLGFAMEEYGLVDNQLKVTLAEHCDGATIINEQPTDIRGRSEHRIRYTSAYNFLIAPRESPINTRGIEPELKSFLDKLLLGEDVFNQMCSLIQTLPKRY